MTFSFASEGCYFSSSKVLEMCCISCICKVLVQNLMVNLLISVVVVDFQFSLPQTSLEMATVEKLLQMQPDSVPCKIRAKRGCATHPRSIAERVCSTSFMCACMSSSS